MNKSNIEFKGKRLDNGEWVYGLPSFNDQGLISEIQIFGGEESIFEFIDVDSATICQFTGFVDVYEGDLVKIKYCGNYYIGKVVFNTKTCGFEIWYKSIVGVYGEKATHKINFAYLQDIEVIGNQYDNPELLEVE